MTAPNQELLTEQHREMELGVAGLVDGSGSRQEFAGAVRLLRQHIHVEETVLFPVLDQDHRRWMALAQMRYEHGDMWPHIEHATALLDAGADLENMLPAAQALLRLLRIHDPREEEAIYAVADRYVADASNPSLAELFRVDSVPANWRCLRAPGGNDTLGDALREDVP